MARPIRHPALTAIATLGLTAVTVVVGLVFAGKISLLPGGARDEGAVFYVVPYHYGFAFYDRDLVEIRTLEVREGETVTLHIVPSQALAEPAVRAYNERTLLMPVGGLAAGDPQIERKIREDLDLGNVEHIIGIAAHAVYVTTNVAPLLDGRPFRPDGPATLREAVRRGDPTIKTVTFTAKRVGAYDVLCVDSGMDGAGTCGWGHKWMVGKAAFVVRPGP